MAVNYTVCMLCQNGFWQGVIQFDQIMDHVSKDQ